MPASHHSASTAEPNAGPRRLLIVDDDKKFCRLLSEYLEPFGYQTAAAHTGPDGAERAVSEAWHAVILDMMLPGMNGLQVLQKIREVSEVPVLMLTARGEEVDRVVGLELGADDYLPKPFNPRELVARMRAILRRSLLPDPSAGRRERIEAGPISLNFSSRTASARGQTLTLTGVEFRVLEVLIQQIGVVVSREQLTRQVLGRRLTPYDRSIDTHISNIRRKLAAVTDEVSIVNVRRSGYVLTVAEPAATAQPQ